MQCASHSGPGDSSTQDKVPLLLLSTISPCLTAFSCGTLRKLCPQYISQCVCILRKVTQPSMSRAFRRITRYPYNTKTMDNSRDVWQARSSSTVQRLTTGKKHSSDGTLLCSAQGRVPLHSSLIVISCNKGNVGSPFWIVGHEPPPNRHSHASNLLSPHALRISPRCLTRAVRAPSATLVHTVIPHLNCPLFESRVLLTSLS